MSASQPSIARAYFVLTPHAVRGAPLTLSYISYENLVLPLWHLVLPFRQSNTEISFVALTQHLTNEITLFMSTE